MSTENPFYDKYEAMTFTLGHLPHINQDQKLYAVTFRLQDSLPKKVLISYMDESIARYGDNQPNFKSNRDAYLHQKMMECMDRGYGECLLRNPDIRKIVEDSFLFIQESMAIIHAYVIMPNHVHMVLETKDDVKIQDVMQSMKHHTSLEINSFLQRKGSVWQREYYDRIIRNQTHYENAVRYIINNPRNLRAGDYSLGGILLGRM